MGLYSVAFTRIFLFSTSLTRMFCIVLELFIDSFCLKLVCDDTRDEQLEGIEADVVHGSLQIGVVLEDGAHKVEVKFDDGVLEQMEDLLELKGVVVWDSLSLSVMFDSSMCVVVILEFSNAYSSLE